LLDCFAMHPASLCGEVRGLRSFAHSGLCGAGNALPVGVAPTAAVHLSSIAPDMTIVQCALADQRVRTNEDCKKTPCFMHFFDHVAFDARATACNFVSFGRCIGRCRPADAPAGGMKKPHGGVDSRKNRD